MEVSREDGEIPIPISSSYGGHMIHHHHDPALLLVVPHSSPQAQSQLLPSCSNGLVPTPTSLSLDNDNDNHDHSTEVVPYNSNGNGKKVVVIKYRECLKNHAAAMGGAATDGCGEFMPSGEEGTIEALTCSACSCHRNFHRKELQGHHHDHFHHHHITSSRNRNRRDRKLILGHHNHLMADALPLGLGYPTPAAAGTLISSRPPPPHHHPHMIMPSSAYNMNMSMDMSDDGTHPHPQALQQVVKKRFRTKFSQEQKDKMVKFAERVGWRIQKQEESVVQQFCQEIGVKRRVLKVWMHNNKHNLANKLIPSTTASTATATAPPPPPPPPDAASLH